MSQFRLTGDLYVSEWNGDPLNPGTDILPYSHPADAPNTNLNNIIVGSGHYLGGYTGIRKLTGDGKVVMDGEGVVLIDGSNIFENIHFKNFESITHASGGVNRIECIFENIKRIGFRGFWTRCVFVNSDDFIQNHTTTSTGGNIVRNCSFYRKIGNGGTIMWGALNSLDHCYIDQNCEFSLTSTNANFISNSMVNGKIKVGATLYESKRLFDGSPRPDADPLVADFIDYNPNFYTNGNFSGEAKIIDIYNRIVQPDSDLFLRSNVHGFIGGVKIGQFISFLNPNFIISYQNVDQSNPDLLRIANGFDFAKIRITGKVSDSLISSQKVDIRIPFFFAGSQLGDTLLNNNAPDALHGLRGIDTLGDLPYRLRFEVRSSQLANANRNNNDDWDNDVTGIPGRWYLMEYGQPMLHHMIAGVAYGNADKFAINSPTKIPFNYRSLDIEITLSNTRSQV